jgi:hypothetical protein
VRKFLIFALLCIPAFAQTAPTLVSYTETASWITQATTKSTASVSWNAGDIIVVLGISEGVGSEQLGGASGLPTATGLTFTNVINHAASSNPALCVATATAASTSSSAVTLTSGLAEYGFGVWVIRNSGGVGNNASQFTSTPTKALTPVQAHSLIIWGVGDWAAATVVGITPTPSDTRENTANNPHYTVYAADLLDQSSTGSTSYGIASGTGPFSIGIIEIKGTGAGATKTCTLSLMGAGPC